MAAIAEAKQKASEEKWGKKEEEVKFVDDGTVHDIEALRTSIPDGVVATKKEQYLSAEQFQAAFGMDKAAFGELKAWRQKKLKQEQKLF